MQFEYEMLCFIVNAGYSEEVMEVAKANGAYGGSVINARGTAKADAEKFFNIPIHPEKEMVMIVVPVEIRDRILHGFYESLSLRTQAQGIAFSLPVDAVAGIKTGK